jgi:predicted Na+-dependent transporter
MVETSSEASDWAKIIAIGILIWFISILLLYASDFSNIDAISYGLIIFGVGFMFIIPAVGFFIKKRRDPKVTELSSKDRDLFSDMGLGAIVICAGAGCIVEIIGRSVESAFFLAICLLFGIPLIYKYIIKKRK